MLFNGIANSDQLTVLTQVLDDYCQSRNFPPHSEERADAGRMIISLFEQGWRKPDELKAILASVAK